MAAMSSTPVRVINVAPDQTHGMTLADLTRFVQDCWARGLHPDQSRIRVQSSMVGRVRQIQAEGPLS